MPPSLPFWPPTPECMHGCVHTHTLAAYSTPFLTVGLCYPYKELKNGVRKLKFREEKRLAQGHMAWKWA